MFVRNVSNLLFYIYFMKVVMAVADFCEFGICDENTEYCCGENICCRKKVEVWYFWAAILLVVISIIILIFFYIRRKHRRTKRYNPVPQNENEFNT